MALLSLPDAEEVRESTAMQVAGRAGMVTRGVLHLLIAALTVAILRGRPDEEAGTQGAIAAVARQPLGRVLVGLIAVGLFAYAAWRAAQAVVGRDDDDPIWKRASAGARALVYVGVGVTAAKAVVRGRGDKGHRAANDQGKQQAAATVLAWPGGRLLVGGAGVAILAIAGYNAYRAVTQSFEDHLELGQMSPTTRTAARVLGVAGHAGRFLAYALAGGLLVLGAIEHDPSSGGGLDQALRRLAGAPLGRAVLVALAAGLAAFGLYQLFEARYRDVAD